MKRVSSVICIIVLVMCLAAFADADSTVYQLPDSLKTVSATADQVSLPAGLPEHAHVVSFSNENGLINVRLDREVPSLKIKELNFVNGEESTIFSRANKATAEAHQAGTQYSIFTMLITWKFDRQKYTEEFNTWSGDLVFDRAGLYESADAGTFPSWDSAERTVSFSEDGILLSETWSLANSEQLLTRTAYYDSDGQLTGCRVSWQAADYSGNLLDVETAPDGTVFSIRCNTKGSSFNVESLPLTAEWQQFANLRDNSYSPTDFDAAFRASYPNLAAFIYGAVPDLFLPATASDLPATATDLPATATDLKTDPEEEPVPEGETTENTRVWLISYGDYFEPTIYIFASDDPLFVIQDGKAVPNPDAKDINGTPVSYKEMGATATPVFDAPAAQ